MLDVETKRGYWLTVYAQDHGVVPLASSLQVCTLQMMFEELLNSLGIRALGQIYFTFLYVEDIERCTQWNFVYNPPNL